MTVTTRAELTLASVRRFYRKHPKRLAVSITMAVASAAWGFLSPVGRIEGGVVGAVLTCASFFAPYWKERVEERTVYPT